MPQTFSSSVRPEEALSLLVGSDGEKARPFGASPPQVVLPRYSSPSLRPSPSVSTFTGEERTIVRFAFAVGPVASVRFTYQPRISTASGMPSPSVSALDGSVPPHQTPSTDSFHE